MPSRRIVLVTATLLLWAGSSAAFEASGVRWVDGAFEMQADIVHPSTGSMSMSGMSWNTAFAGAAAEWNTSSGGLVDIMVNEGVFEDPCGPNNGIHGVDFGTDICGETGFGSTTIAVARTTFTIGGLVVHANIVFDQNEDFDIFTGPLTGATADFRRVAVHEIGHLLGLNHSLVSPAIMESITSDVEIPQADDLAGISFVHDLVCPQFSSSTGAPISGRLAASDCFDTEVGLPQPTIGVATEPDAFVDLYRVEVAGEPLSFTLSIPDPEDGFNPVLMLVDDSLITEVESNFETPTMTSLDPTPAAGNYVLVVRGVFEGEGGAYTLTGVPAVPEPTSSALGAAALATLGGLARARRKRGALSTRALVRVHSAIESA